MFFVGAQFQSWVCRVLARRNGRNFDERKHSVRQSWYPMRRMKVFSSALITGKRRRENVIKINSSRRMDEN